jgi:DNA mismatch repair protein MutS2
MNNNILEDSDFLKQLNFNHFIDYFFEHSSFPLFIKNNIFSNFLSRKILKQCLEKTQFFIDEVNYDESNEIFHKLQKLKEFNLRKIIDMVSKEAFVSASEINTCVLIIEIFKDHKTFISNSKISSNNFEDLLKFYNKYILKNFRSFVDTDGNVNYQNHPQLKFLHHKLLQTETKIRQVLNEYKVDPEINKLLQHDGIDSLNDRFVLAFRSDSYNSKLGQIVSRSESGRTLYIEPTVIKDLNNSRIETIIEIKSMVDQLLKIVTKELSLYTKDLFQLEHIMIKLDEYYLRSSFAKKYHLHSPSISTNFSYQLTGAFHPLIEKPVRNDINLEEDDFSLIISGPNTGGKTALIKTVSLCQLFFNYGLFVPAREATLYPVDKIFYFGADQQDLDSGLSSFSAEVKNYNHLLDNLNNTNLIVIDEIFNSTSSEEASALAISMFEYIYAHSNSKLIVSTHHQTLKSLLHSKKGYLSAHVGFDHETLSPTYKLHIGVPGGSQALDIFNSSDESDRTKLIYKNALRFLDNKSIHYEKLLNLLSQKESKLEKVLAENKEINIELKNQKSAAQGVLNLKIENELNKAQTKFKKIIDKAYHVLENSKEGSYKNKKKLINEETKLKTLFNEFDQTKKRKDEGLKQTNLILPESFTIGATYFCSFLNQDVVLKEILAKDFLVSKGAMRVKIPKDTLFISQKQNVKQTVTVSVEQSSNAQFEYDCRGMRLHEFQSLVESKVYALECGDVPFLNFIHGHGNGTLKKWIRKYIKDYKGLEIDKNETGNDGETRIVTS